MLRWRPKWASLSQLLIWCVFFAVFSYLAFYDGIPASIEWIDIFLMGSSIYLGICELLDFLNLNSPMRIEVVSNPSPELRIFTRALREPVIEDHHILRASRSDDAILLFFLSNKQNNSIWFRPLFSWPTSELHLRIKKHQFASVEDWRTLYSLLEHYPGKREQYDLARKAA